MKGIKLMKSKEEIITIRRVIFRALVEEHLKAQGFPGTEKELEDCIDTYEEIEKDRVIHGDQYDG